MISSSSPSDERETTPGRDSDSDTRARFTPDVASVSLRKCCALALRVFVVWWWCEEDTRDAWGSRVWEVLSGKEEGRDDACAPLLLLPPQLLLLVVVVAVNDVSVLRARGTEGLLSESSPG